MKTSFDIEQSLFKALNVSAVKNAIDGGIYLGDTRPVDSCCEDITINTITISQDTSPQTATSNINIHVPDIVVKLDDGRINKIADRVRLKAIATKVLSQLRSTKFAGMKCVPMILTTIQEPTINQHYINIRCDWNIQID